MNPNGQAISTMSLPSSADALWDCNLIPYDTTGGNFSPTELLTILQAIQYVNKKITSVLENTFAFGELFCANSVKK